MAARDLQVHHWRPAPRGPREDEISRDATEDNLPAVVLKSLLVRRWWALLLIALISGSVAFFASEEVSSTTAEVESTLIHVGLPNLPGANVYEEMSAQTCAALLTSPHALNQLREQRQLSLPPASLAKQLVVTTRRGTGLIDVKLTWPDPYDGVEMLNQLSANFIENVAAMRRERLREHMKHVEVAALEASSEVDAARQRIERLRREQHELLASDGQNADQYRSALSNIANTQLAIDEKRLQELGVRQQMQALGEKLTSIAAQRVETIEELRTQTFSALIPILESAKEKFVETSDQHRKLEGLVQQFQDELSGPDGSTPVVQQVNFEEDASPTIASTMDLDQWRRELNLNLARHSDLLSTADHEEVAFVLQQTLEAGMSKLKSLTEEMKKLQHRREEHELALIPLGNQLKMLETRLSEYNQQAADIGTGVTGLGLSQLEEARVALEKAVSRQDAFALQLDNMKQLEQCRGMEWAVSVPASLDAALVDSNRKKIAVLIFGACALVLGGPLFLLERQHCRELPQIRTARSLGLPILAERVLKQFSPNRRSPWLLDQNASGDQVEALRMLALRVQQSAHRKGTVILMTSMDDSYASVPLTAAVAQCLADREEKVLIVDAVSPGKSRVSFDSILAPVLESSPAASGPGTSSESSNEALQPTTHELGYGLSELLSGKSSSPDRLIKPSGIPNVDVLSRGTEPFPREAMATSSLTRLLDVCRESYSIILVHGPSARNAADTQMLTARADGVVILAGSKTHRDHAAQACVKDLVELGAPIIGVVA